ncbi:ROK family protein [Lacticaseibacillus zhaodongensis]|uniref:ROK family protein n=1 Tax=Lacticaseibacillus zhaodongensis TaxID=2668065 RepID=UPI0012D2F3E0|nr:ROK family protein [Lacticaseibacillus zhaodongensis]
MKLGSIEAGGTKFILAVADNQMHIIERKRIETRSPELTISDCVDFFKANPVDAIGIGSFGPIDINPDSTTYGYVLKTPKPNWSNTDFVGPLQTQLHVPIAFTTDVNASAYGEYTKCDAKSTVVYFTIGTGIGGGAVQAGHFIGSSAHPEMGHTLITPRADDDFAGNCPFHGNRCFEGMASGPAIEARTGKPGEQLSRTDPVFDLVSYYAAEMAYNTYMQMRPDKIVFGGSVLKPEDMPRVRKYFSDFNNDYVATPALESLITFTSIPNNGSATLGDFELAARALSNK